MARLRREFAAVAEVRCEAESLERALRIAEDRLREPLRRLVSDAFSTGGPPVVAPQTADADFRGAVPSSPGGRGRSGGALDRAKAAVEGARSLATSDTIRDLRRALDDLAAARPPECGTLAGSAVCHPAPADVWTGIEFDPSGPAAGEDPEAVFRLIDGFFGGRWLRGIGVPPASLPDAP
jgi:hypothetical protein